MVPPAKIVLIGAFPDARTEPPGVWDPQPPRRGAFSLPLSLASPQLQFNRERKSYVCQAAGKNSRKVAATSSSRPGAKGLSSPVSSRKARK